jgi:hypothetical protein
MYESARCTKAESPKAEYRLYRYFVSLTPHSSLKKINMLMCFWLGMGGTVLCKRS